MVREIRGVWDADFIPFIVCHNRKDSEEKTLEDCIIQCDEMIFNINTAIKCDTFVGFLTKGKCFRYTTYPKYKANRQFLEPPKFMNEVKDHLINTYGFKYELEYEADDLVLSYSIKNKEVNCIIISPDKDILNLEGCHYNPRTAEFVYTSKEGAEKYFWKSMMIGDTADNIKGIKGIGPVAASKIVDELGLFESLRTTIMNKYCEIYGEREGIKEFYVNYYCLKIVDNIHPTLLEVKLNKNVLSE
jgi:5'-3' exonuclease